MRPFSPFLPVKNLTSATRFTPFAGPWYTEGKLETFCGKRVVEVDAKQLAGRGCGRRYEKEYLNKYRDCMLFYCDGKARFERYCYGEGACFVFGVWAVLEADGTLRYRQPLPPLAAAADLPQRLTAVEGDVLYFDNDRWKWELAADLALDKKNGYTRLRMLAHRLTGR